MYNFLKRSLLFALTVILLAGTVMAPNPVYAKRVETIIDKSELKNGIIIVDYNEKKTGSKIRVTKDDAQYQYDLSHKVRIPLQLGNGDYKVEVLEKIKGNKYRQVAEETVNYNDTDGKKVFLQSNIIINWNKDMAAVKKAKTLTKNAKTDSEKAAAIYTYIIKNIKYDNKKAQIVQDGYIPSVSNIYKTKKGICYDYSVLFAVMLRSVGVPAKVLMGTSTDVKEYHAWNQVYIKETEKWITVDTTIDAGLKKMNADSMVKKASHYVIEKQY